MNELHREVFPTPNLQSAWLLYYYYYDTVQSVYNLGAGKYSVQKKYSFPYCYQWQERDSPLQVQLRVLFNKIYKL